MFDAGRGVAGLSWRNGRVESRGDVADLSILRSRPCHHKTGNAWGSAGAHEPLALVDEPLALVDERLAYTAYGLTCSGQSRTLPGPQPKMGSSPVDSTYRTLLCALGTPLLVGACAPVLKNLTVADQQEGVIGQAQVDLHSRGATLVGGLQMSLRQLQPPGDPAAPAVPAGQMAPTSAPDADGFLRHEGAVSGGPRYGIAELSVRQEYHPPGTNNLSVSASTSFMVDAPPSCFGFDQGASGWTQRGVLRADGSPWLFNGDPARYRIDGPAGWQNHVNWPAPSTTVASNFNALEGAGALAPGSAGNARGSLRLQVRANWPVAQPPGPPPNDRFYWRVDWISPTLAGQPQWQGINRYSVRAAAQAAGFQVLPRLLVSEPGQPQRMLEPRNLPAPRALSAGGTWDLVEASFDMPPGATVTGALVSVLGETDFLQGAHNHLNSVYIDAVCALR